MKLGKYVEKLNEYLSENPEHAGLTVIAGIDSEGNGFNEIDPPAHGFDVGVYEDNEFYTLDDEDAFDDPNPEPNAFRLD